jgi:Uma2 family endonuclease
MNQLPTKIITDTWIKGCWNDYLQAIKELDIQNNYYKSYYYDQQYKMEMTPISFDHGCDHSIVTHIVNLYGTLKDIDFRGIYGSSYRKVGYREAQPDASYYCGEKADIIPYGTSIIDLDQYPAPDLVIEVAKSTLADDLGNKRLLYEELGVLEYWVVDVQNVRVIAFKIVPQGSQRIETSQVLSGLNISLLNEALRHSREMNHRRVGQWFMAQIQ